MPALNVVSKIKHYACKEINYQRETDREERSVDKKQPEFRCRDVKTIAQVGANPKRVTLKKCKYAL